MGTWVEEMMDNFKIWREDRMACIYLAVLHVRPCAGWVKMPECFWVSHKETRLEKQVFRWNSVLCNRICYSVQTVCTHKKGFGCQWTIVSDSNLPPFRGIPRPSSLYPLDQWKLGLLTLRPYPFDLHISSLLSNPFRATEIVSSGLLGHSSANSREPIKLFGGMPNIITIQNHHNIWDPEVRGYERWQHF